MPTVPIRASHVPLYRRGIAERLYENELRGLEGPSFHDLSGLDGFWDWLTTYDVVGGGLTQAQLEKIKAETDAAMLKACQGLPQVECEQRRQQALQELDNFAHSSGVHPDDVGLHLPNLDPSAWLRNNWPILALVGVGVIVVLRVTR